MAWTRVIVEVVGNGWIRLYFEAAPTRYAVGLDAGRKRTKMVSNFLHKNWTDGMDSFLETGLTIGEIDRRGRFSVISVHVKLEMPVRCTRGSTESAIGVTEQELGQRSWLAVSALKLSAYRSLSWRPSKGSILGRKE